MYSIPANFFWVKGVRFLSWECQDFRRRYDNVRSFPKTSEVFRRRSEHIPIPVRGRVLLNTTSFPMLFFCQNSEISGKISPLTHFTWSFRFSHWFEFTFFGKCVVCGCNNSHFSARREELIRKRELAWDRSFQLAGVRVGRYSIRLFKHWEIKQTFKGSQNLTLTFQTGTRLLKIIKNTVFPCWSKSWELLQTVIL